MKYPTMNDCESMLCMSDDGLRNVRDLDMFEMQRRGYTRWRAQ